MQESSNKNEKIIKGIKQEEDQERGIERTFEWIFLHIFMTWPSLSPRLEVSP